MLLRACLFSSYPTFAIVGRWYAAAGIARGNPHALGSRTRLLHLVCVFVIVIVIVIVFVFEEREEREEGERE